MPSSFLKPTDVVAAVGGATYPFPSRSLSIHARI
jgi:hypothetical protein